MAEIRQDEARTMIEAAVNMKASDIYIIAGKQGYTNIFFRSYGRSTRYQTMISKEATMMIEAIFNVANDVAGEGPMSLRQGTLTKESNLIPKSLQMIRLQYTPQSNHLGALAMRLIPYSLSSDNDIAGPGYTREHLIGQDHHS